MIRARSSRLNVPGAASSNVALGRRSVVKAMATTSAMS